MTQDAVRWWETRWFAALLILLAALPLLRPAIPPLVDLPGHMATYKAELDYARSASLQHYYSFRWTLVGNLGVNLLVVPLARLIGLEPAVKWIVLAIPVLATGGFLWLSRELHGRISPTTLFALPLAYNFPFLFGFVNFALSMALAFLSLALWVRLGRQGRARLRAVLFVPLSCLVWLAHVYGWAFVGAVAFAIELTGNRERGQDFAAAAIDAVLRCVPLGVAVVPLIVWRSGDVAGATEGWLSIVPKVNYLITPLRDRWMWLDLPSLLVLAALLIWAWRSPRLRLARGPMTALLLLVPVYFVMPQRIFGSGYADMRLYPYLLILALIAIAPTAKDPRFRQTLAVAGLGFFLFRLGVNSTSLWLYDESFRRELPALDHVPVGARLASFIGAPCRGVWKMRRLDHLPGLAVVRREAFSNEQWSVAGAQLLLTRYQAAAPFDRDPSQIVRISECPVNRWRTLDESLRLLPREAFDYLWLVEPPAYDPRLTAGMEPVWRSGASILFRIPHPTRGQGE